MQREVIFCADCEGTRDQLRLLLDILDRARINVTFFFVGKTAEENPDLVRHAARTHQIETHTYSHRNLRRLTREAQREEILRAKQIVEGLIGRPTHGFRAPMHCYNRDTAEILKEEGFVFDASALYFYHDISPLRQVYPTWFREWMPLYERFHIKPRWAFNLFRLFYRMNRRVVLPIHPHYSAKTPELAHELQSFIADVQRDGGRFLTIDEALGLRPIASVVPVEQPDDAREANLADPLP
ncbi:MAG: polysaccharide deacetylase family protein [bacterium]